MSASNLKDGVDLEDLKTTIKAFIEKYFDLKEKDYHQVDVKINEPLADTINVTFINKVDFYNQNFDKLVNTTQLTKSLNDEIKKLDPNIEITNIKWPKVSDYPVEPGRIIHS